MASSPGQPILAECPKRYDGQSQRICELRDFGKPTWLMPNFSGCLADTLVDVYNEVSFEHTYKLAFNPRFSHLERHKSEKEDQRETKAKASSAELGHLFFGAAQLKFNENSL